MRERINLSVDSLPLCNECLATLRIQRYLKIIYHSAKSSLIYSSVMKYLFNKSSNIMFTSAIKNYIKLNMTCQIIFDLNVLKFYYEFQ